MNLRDIPNEMLRERAPEVPTSWIYLYQIKTGIKTPSKAMAERIAEVFGLEKEKVMWPDSKCCPCEEKAANE